MNLPGGPGSRLPSGLFARFTEARFTPFVRAGYAVWTITRPRGMPAGHTVADMAADCARFIEGHVGSPVDLLIGESYGGMIALHVAAEHPDVVRRVVVLVAAATVTPEGTDIDVRWARARADGRHADAGSAFLEYLLPGPRAAGLRRALGPLAGRLFADASVPAGDLRVEADAEEAFDARPVLPRINVPVLMLCGDRDLFFSREAVRRTSEQIPDCTLVWYRGMGHMRAASTGRVPKDVLGWVARREGAPRTHRPA
ncbi:hypothetical protein GCM10027517_18220 [Phycicoccus ginsengisoli]